MFRSFFLTKNGAHSHITLDICSNKKRRLLENVPQKLHTIEYKKQFQLSQDIKQDYQTSPKNFATSGRKPNEEEEADMNNFGFLPASPYKERDKVFGGPMINMERPKRLPVYQHKACKLYNIIMQHFQTIVKTIIKVTTLEVISEKKIKSIHTALDHQLFASIIKLGSQN